MKWDFGTQSFYHDNAFRATVVFAPERTGRRPQSRFVF